MTLLIVPNELYNIYIYDWDGHIVHTLRNWNYLEYHQRVNNSWNCQITIECSINDPVAEILRSLEDDYFILVYRVDPITLENTLVYEGFHLTLVDQITSNGNLILNLYSGGYTDLLKRRIIIPAVGQENLTYSGMGETVLKIFVNDCAVSTSDPNRVMPGLAIEPDTTEGIFTEQSFRYTNLYTACTTIADAGDIDFGVYGSEPPGKFYLRARKWWGVDRRETNIDGNSIAVFDIDYNTMEIPILSTNASEEKNHTYVGGEGSGVDRVIQEVADFVAELRTPWNRKEAFVEGSQQTTIDSLQSRGLAYLKDNRKQQNLSFGIRSTNTLRWPRDWGLGDIVSAKYFGKVFDKHIIEIGVVVSPSTSGLIETINVEMEDVS